MSRSRIACCEEWTSLDPDWLEPFGDGTEAWVMVEDAAKECFCTLQRSSYDLLRDPEPPWDKGIVFSRLHELKWRRRFGLWSAVFLTDDPSNDLPDGFTLVDSIRLEKLELQEPDDQLVLWGEGDDETALWFEDRIPKDLSYPVKPSRKRERLALLYCAYRVFENGSPATHPLTRFRGVKTI